LLAHLSSGIALEYATMLLAKVIYCRVFEGTHILVFAKLSRPASRAELLPVW
jgi:hypothetical protein